MNAPVVYSIRRKATSAHRKSVYASLHSLVAFMVFMGENTEHISIRSLRVKTRKERNGPRFATTKECERFQRIILDALIFASCKPWPLSSIYASAPPLAVMRLTQFLCYTSYFESLYNSLNLD